MPELLRAAAALSGAVAVAGGVAAKLLQRPVRLPGAAAAPPARSRVLDGLPAPLRNLLAAGRRRAGRHGGRDGAGLELALLALAAELEAGVDLLTALRRVLAHLPAGTAADLRWSLDHGAPRDGVDAVRRWAGRTGDPMLQDLAATLALHRGTGGPLGPMLRRLAEISRRRRLLAAQLRARTAEARLSAVILAAAPGLLAGFTAAWRPELLAPLWTDGAGRAALIYAVISWSAGVAWIRAMLAGAGRGGE